MIDHVVTTSRLSNGLRVTTVALPHLHTATVALFIKVGSHFVEHMSGSAESSARNMAFALVESRIGDGALWAEFASATSIFHRPLAA